MRREGDLRLVERLCDGALRVRRHVGARWCVGDVVGRRRVRKLCVGLVPLFLFLLSNASLYWI